MTHDEFWRLTYAEFVIRYKEHIKTLNHRRNEMIFTAWHVAYFSRVTKLPSLKSVLIEEEKREQSVDEMIAICRMMNAALGGKEIKT